MTLAIETKNYFINRDLSWLDFNARVLEEAYDKNLPILDRLKFVAIFSNNLDEFFMVRAAGLKQQLDAGHNEKDLCGLSVGEQIEEIKKRVQDLLSRQYALLTNDILPEMRRKGIVILNRNEYGVEERNEISKIFKKLVFPVLTPIAVDPSHPFPVVNNCAIGIAVELKTNKSRKVVKALVEVPSVLPRFVVISTKKYPGLRCYVMLEDIILEFINELFSGCEIVETTLFRITKDMDFSVDDDGVDDLLSHIKKELLRRRKRHTLRLELLKDRRGKIENWLMEQLGIDQNSKYIVDGPLHLANFLELLGKESGGKLVEEEWPPLPHHDFKEEESIIKTIADKKNIPLFLPFQSFSPVIRLLEEAASDPNVLAIKQTLYRVGGDPPVVRALQRAAENGKQVTVIVELKARFDEGNNIVWAKRLEDSGVHVIYGIPGLKIHCKALMIIRKEKSGIQRYLHLSTGNYNDKTAKIYTDIGLFTNDQILASDISFLFNVMTGYSEPPASWKKIAVAPFDLKEKFISLIDREARLSTVHNPGRIIAKMNSLVDDSIIEHLYKAACVGVKIDLIVRGICSLKPGQGTDNIRVTSIIDRYLEHSRVYYFQNAGAPEYYMSSADWMPRNLYKRIEILFPVEDERMKKNLGAVLEYQLNDTMKKRELIPSGLYTESDKTGNNREYRSQKQTYEFFKKLLAETK
jgi:polyphosphate kinase